MDQSTKKVMFSTGTPDWETPDDFYDRLNEEFKFTLDPASDEKNARCKKHYIEPPWKVEEADDGRLFRTTIATRKKNVNGLELSWHKQNSFTNPPYGDPEQPCKNTCEKKRCKGRSYHVIAYQPGIIDWVAKAHAEALIGGTHVMLLPSRTDTNWWHKFVMRAYEIRLVKGRLHFKGAPSSAPFPSAVAIFQKHSRRYPIIRTMEANG